MTRSRLAALVTLLMSSFVPAFAHANLCEKSNITDRHRTEAKTAEGDEGFVNGVTWPSSGASSSTSTSDYVGDREYNAWILSCNRQRDNRGKEIDQDIDAATGGTFAKDLPEASIKGQYSFYGDSLATHVFTSLEYRYLLKRVQGTWIVTLPIDLDLKNLSYAGKGKVRVPLENRLDVSQYLAVELGVMSPKGKGTLPCDQGQEKWTSVPGAAKVVDTGFIGPDDATYDGVACRLPMDSHVPGGRRLLDEYYRHWRDVIETAWAHQGFTVEVLILDHDTIDADLLKQIKQDDLIWHVHTTLDPQQRARYRSGFLWEPHMYTGAYPSTIAHEAGHELGLDDEYRENDKGGKNAWRDCSGDHLELPGASYLMCNTDSISSPNDGDAWFTARAAVTHPDANKAIYPWIITRRYAVGLKAQCHQDSDCGGDQYCDQGGFAKLGRNSCVKRKRENETCGADNQCLAGTVCKGKPFGRCITEASVALGGTCTRDAQCKTGSCNSDDVCQCTADTDCLGTQYCHEGFAGIGQNRCEAKRSEDEACGSDSQCIAPATCMGKPLGRCGTANMVALGGSCSRNDQCTTGSCDDKGVCQCTNDHDCTGNEVCKKGFLGIGRNVCVDGGANLALKAECRRDVECLSGSCSSKGRCQCKVDHDCDPGQSCKTPIFKENYCE